jgi:hypothetical protein
MLPARGPFLILDVGAGLGFFSSSLLQSTDARAATCVDPSYRENRDEARMGKPLLFRRSVDRSDADLVLLMNLSSTLKMTSASCANTWTKWLPGRALL